MTFKLLPFKQIGINATQYTGMSNSNARKNVINVAVDWLADNSFVGLEETDFPINYALSYVDWLCETVAIKIELKLEN